MEHPDVELYDPSTIPYHVARLKQRGLTVWELSVFEVMMLSEEGSGGVFRWVDWMGYDPRTIERVAFTHPLVDDGSILVVGARERVPDGVWPLTLFRAISAAIRRGA